MEPQLKILSGLVTAALALSVCTTAFAHGVSPKIVINGKVQDYGPLTPLIGTWKSVPGAGLDVAPGQVGSAVGKGRKASSPFYEIITFRPNIPDTNNSSEFLISLSYHQAIYRKSNNHWFHDQIGYLTYDKTNNLIYDTSCIPRSVCFVAEGRPASPLVLTTRSQGIAQAQYMIRNDATNSVKVTLDVSGSTLKYRYETSLFVYGKPFAHTDNDVLTKVAH